MVNYAMKFLYVALVYIPLQLAWNAVLGWSDDQLAIFLGIKSPTASQVYKMAVEIAPSLAVAALFFYMYHLWWSRRALHDTKPMSSIAVQNELTSETREVPQFVKSSYLTAYETVHYLSDKSEWGARTAFEVTNGGLHKNPLLDAPLEFQLRAQEGLIRVYGRSRHGGVHELIDKTYWMSAGFQIEGLYNASQPANKTSATHAHPANVPIFEDLKIVAEDIYRIWPRKMLDHRDTTGKSETATSTREKSELDFNLGYAKGGYKQSVANSLLYLTLLRSEGVVIRNNASKLQFVSDLDAWTSEVNDWMKEAIKALNVVSEADSVWFETLDAVPPARVPIPQTGFEGSADRTMFESIFRQHDYRLMRLNDLLTKYKVGA